MVLWLLWELLSFSSIKPQRIVIAGSSCMGRLLTSLGSAALANSNMDVEVQLGGTELGLMALRQGVADIASCSRELNTAEQREFLTVTAALDAIAVIVNVSNPVSDLSIDQLNDIYSGKVSNWVELSGPDIPIVVVGREAGSGTRTAFESGIKLSLPPCHGQELCETGMVMTSVATIKGAIGYISLEYAGKGTKALAIDGVLPNEEAIRTGSYPLSRKLLLCIKKDSHSPQVLDFLKFVKSDAGSAVIRSLGIIPERENNINEA